MAYLISRETTDTITTAWLATAEYLNGNGREREEFDLVVAMADAAPARIDPGVVAAVDALLKRKGFFSVETVANTIFPAQLAATSPTREQLYSRYLALLPRLRKLPKNGKGLYFERLIRYPLQDEPDRANQIEMIIRDLKAQLARRQLKQGPLGSAYEAQIYAPGKDRLPQGFPCMSSLSFQLDGNALRLSATYRNQYYIQKALGNFLGLARLQRFVANAVGLEQGPLTIHAFHACINPQVSKGETATLLRRCLSLGAPPQQQEAA